LHFLDLLGRAIDLYLVTLIVDPVGVRVLLLEGNLIDFLGVHSFLEILFFKLISHETNDGGNPG
jgi:hypothetical protein